MKNWMKYSRSIGLMLIALYFFSKNYITYPDSVAIAICISGVILLFVGFVFDKNVKNGKKPPQS
ncbi:MAG: hypothetical protein LLG09_00090 [Negativicutes bacterium]|nr:hypothetical protein [Negativicutes bacterium]